MLYSSAHCLVYSKDADLIGKLIMHGHKVHYDSNVKNLLREMHEVDPDLIVLDLFENMDTNAINSFIQVHGYLIIRGSISPDILAKMDEKKVILIPEGTSNDAIIERISHINESVSRIDTSGKPQILIIEDNLDILEMYRIAFSTKGYEIYESTDGLAGVTQAVTHRPEIIILDIMMPHMDGFEVLHTLRNNTSLGATIIVNSNLEGVNEEKKVKELGADYFLRKSEYTPLDVVSFVEKIREKTMKVS